MNNYLIYFSYLIENDQKIFDRTSLDKMSDWNRMKEKYAYTNTQFKPIGQFDQT